MLERRKMSHNKIFLKFKAMIMVNANIIGEPFRWIKLSKNSSGS